MSYIYPIKFSFDTNIHRDITIKQIEYLRSFFSSFFGSKYNINKDKKFINKYKTIPISYSKISKHSDILSKKLNNYLISEYQILDSEKKFKNQSDLVVVDIKANFRNLAIVPLSSEIESILQKDINNSNPRFVIILEDIPAVSESLISIKNYILGGKVLLIDKKKRFQYKDEKFKINKDFSFDDLAKTALDKTKFKLIRKIGHYGRYENEKKKEKKELIACNQYFYDGADCDSDISDILFDKIIELQDKESFDVSKIIYHCPESPWLENSLTLLNTDLLNLKNDYNFNYNGLKNINSINDVFKSSENILFVVSLIHSGDTFRREYNKLKTIFPNSRIKAIAVLFSGEGTHFKPRGNYIDIPISEDELISVNFLLSVNQKQYPKFQRCPMCYELQMEIRDSSYINTDVLTSFETWTMCDEAGYMPEDYVPGREEPYPSLLSIKPNSLKLIKENGAYIAIKYMKHIERNNLLQTPDLTLVFPDETSNKKEIEKRGPNINLEDTPSGYFAETLMQLKEVEYFGIPREIIEKLKDKEEKFSLSDIQVQYKEFYNKLKLLSDDIIIMDEFGLSGSTLRKIIKIIDIVNKKPKAYFPIFNFNPMILNEDKLNGLKVISLYDFNIKFD